ncbi:hypothetical protein SAMN05880582_1011544 [Rhizobium sp. RU20A]|nr:hypothetical protein SAMN05880582_1011544 [Rhizobium sp. RU20A]
MCWFYCIHAPDEKAAAPEFRDGVNADAKVVAAMRQR